MVKKIINLLFILCVIVHWTGSVSAQATQLLSDLLEVQAALESIPRQLQLKGVDLDDRHGGGGNPIFALQINRLEFQHGQKMEVDLFSPSLSTNSMIFINPGRINLSSGEVKYYFPTKQVLSSWEKVRIHESIIDGAEQTGIYVFFVKIFKDFELVAMPSSLFVIGAFGNLTDEQWPRIESAEMVNPLSIRAKGSFFPMGSLDQMLIVNGNIFTMSYTVTPTEAFFVCNGACGVVAGRHDVLYILKLGENLSYDVAQLPGGLRVPNRKVRGGKE